MRTLGRAAQAGLVLAAAVAGAAVAGAPAALHAVGSWCGPGGSAGGACAAPLSEHVLVQRAQLLASKVAGSGGPEAAGAWGAVGHGRLDLLASEAAAGSRDDRGRVAASSPLAPSVVERFGALRVEGSRILSSETNLPVRLRGMSLFWSHWIPKFWNHDALRWLKEDWNVTLVRAAMGVEYGGYLANPEAERARLEAVVDAAILEGLYVIIDWHDHNADLHLEQAKAFFRDMAVKYGRLPNVLFEVFNEPVKQLWNTTIKPYHEQLVQVIRQHSQNIIILGTRLWSQEVDVAASDPVAGENLAYTVHFYASTHRSELRQKVTKALATGVAIFATEWGACDASGDGMLDFGETQRWLDFFESHGISDANWAVGDKVEACAALKPGASASGAWAPCDLTSSGAFVRALLRSESPPPEHLTSARCPWHPKPPSPNCSQGGDDCSKTACCKDVSHTCFAKNPYFATCKASCTEGIDPLDPPAYRSPWSCEIRKPPPPVGCSRRGDDCSETGCCEDLSLACYRKNDNWASCRANCTAGIDPLEDPAYRSPWTCEPLTRQALH